jgi:hypothetical protein
VDLANYGDHNVPGIDGGAGIVIRENRPYDHDGVDGVSCDRHVDLRLVSWLPSRLKGRGLDGEGSSPES